MNHSIIFLKEIFFYSNFEKLDNNLYYDSFLKVFCYISNKISYTGYAFKKYDILICFKDFLAKSLKNLSFDY